MSDDDDKKTMTDLKKTMADLRQRMTIAGHIMAGAKVYEIWQVAPVGSDTEIGQMYLAIKKQSQGEEP